MPSAWSWPHGGPETRHDEAPRRRFWAGKPGPALAPYIDHYEYLDIDIPEHYDRFLSPTAEVGLAFSLSSRRRIARREPSGGLTLYPDSVIVGPQSHRGDPVTFTGGIRAFYVSFRPVGFYRLFRLPVADLADRCFDSADVLGPAGETLRRHLMASRQPAAMVAIVERFFSVLLDSAAEASELHYVTTSLSGAGSPVRISDLLGDVGWSRRRLERRFAQQVGLTAKQFAKIVRFRRALQMKAAEPGRSWTDITHSADYYDQAHLGKDFSALVKTSPSDYFAGITRYPELELFLSQYSPERA